MVTQVCGNQGLYDSSYEHDNCGIGFVANIKGIKSHEIVVRGLEVLERMEHRGAESADNKTGDGSGIMIQIPHEFYISVVKGLPDEGKYGTGFVFLPKDKESSAECIKTLEKIISDEGLSVAAWRYPEVKRDEIGEIAQKSEPLIGQVFITAPSGMDPKVFERKLYVIRKLAERTVRESTIGSKNSFYIVSLSSKTIVYKGMLMPDQVRKYFPELVNKDLKSSVALVHSRFSTNTFPAWELAQPFRMLAHNGEINTVKGNRFWMQARESLFKSPEFGDDIKKILPVVEPERSDSASFDNVLELLVATGRSLPHAVMMMVPESWNDKNPISDDLKRFYEYHATFLEPWDGPASIVFFDGRYVGGTLDRNGLRPSRYVLTKDDILVMGSEVGVQDFAPENVARKGRLQPGKLLLVDIELGRIIPDSEIKNIISYQKPYREWVQNNSVNIADIEATEEAETEMNSARLHELQQVYAYNREDVGKLIPELCNNGQEATSSMGTDTPIAVFSDKPQPLYNYFKQMFAQVTNPAIDSIREELVMTLTSYMGRQQNMLDETAEHCKMLKFTNPVFTNTDLLKVRNWNNVDFRTAVIDITFSASEGKGALEKSMNRICQEAEKAVDDGYTFLLLSDRKISSERAPIPTLLASSGVHHHLIRVKKRTRAGIIVETGEAREVMHFALLFGYGADAVNPYGAYASINGLFNSGELKVDDYHQAEHNFIKGISKGLLKVLSKMGTSTLRSYRASQIFECVGLGEDVIDRYFTGTVSRISGIGLAEIEKEALMKHDKAYVHRVELLDSEGVYRYRKAGEKHAWNPETIYMIQWATRTNDYSKYRQFADKINSENARPHVIRGLLDFRNGSSISVDQVESVEEIMKRFTTGAMSYGSISQETHETIAIAMNSISGRSNSGEGGENPERFRRRPDGTSARSAIKQVASGRFGVTSNYLANADEIQIKISQGAKPGEGGQLPGHKVDEIIGRTRHSTPGVTLISPPPHHDIYSIEDLAQLIFDLKNANPNARISVKLVSEAGVGTIAAGVAKAHADNILISGYDGGTGASPQSSIKHAGLPWELGMSETHQTLVKNGLRGRVRMQTDGQLKTGRDVVIAGMLGAEEFGFGTSVLIVLGCVMMRKCHSNTCPFGVATQDPELRKRFRGKPEHLINFFRFIAEDVREILAELGFKKFDDIIGRTDLLEMRSSSHWKASKVKLDKLLFRPAEADIYANFCQEDQVHKIHNILDLKLIEAARPALESKKPVTGDFKIGNTDRTVGTMLSYNVSTHFSEDGLPDGTVKFRFSGSAGQSFGAFLAAGTEFRLEGDTNDYLGKGLSGGRIIVVPPKGSTFIPEENIIVGNTVLYGATRGELYVRGVAGERFCVRNSGAEAVVEGTGDHCAEYMTGGRLVVLGKTGRNFAAGMSGGIAYVLDMIGDFRYYCNKGMVEMSELQEYEDVECVKRMISNHRSHTESALARKILDNWSEYQSKFVKIIPYEYKRALKEMNIKAINEKLTDVISAEEIGRTV